jgi:hypothetical protein
MPLSARNERSPPTNCPHMLRGKRVALGRAMQRTVPENWFLDTMYGGNDE